MKLGKVGTGLFLVLFLVFTSAGGYFVYRSLWMISYGIGSESWKKTPCEISSLELKASNNNKGSSESKVVEASFSYRYDGKSYKSSRFSVQSFWGTADNIIDYEKEVNQVRERKPPYCFVNPEYPELAVLNAGIPKMAFFEGLFGLIFASSGLGVGGALGVSLMARNTMKNTFLSTKELIQKRYKAFIALPVISSLGVLTLLIIYASWLVHAYNSEELLNIIAFSLTGIVGTGLVVSLWIYASKNYIAKIVDPPGREKPFCIEFGPSRMGQARVEKTEKTEATINMRKRITYYRRSSGQVTTFCDVASIEFTLNGTSRGRYQFVSIADKYESLLYQDEEEPPGFFERLKRSLKNNARFMATIHDDESAGLNNLARSLKGGKGAEQALKEAVRFLEAYDDTIELNFKFASSRLKAEIPLTLYVWKSFT